MLEFHEVARGLGFVEGPIIRPDGSHVVTSISHGVIYGLGDEGVRVVATVGGGPNGLTEDSQGTLYIAQNGGAAPGRPTPGICGGVQVIRAGRQHADWLTKDPIAPNDLCFGPDGYLYVTDPTRTQRRDDGRLWRVDTATGESELLCSVPWYANGIGFSPLDDGLYVASTGERRIYRMDIGRPGPTRTELWVEMPRGHPDGFAFDTDGNMVVAAVSFADEPGCVQVWDPAGTMLDLIEPGTDKMYTNLALGDRELLLCESGSGRVLRCEWPGEGALLHPFR